jgi:phosphatidylinositol glycan class B
MRGTLPVFMAYGFMKTFSFIENPFTVVFIFRLFSALLGVFALVLLLRHFRPNFSEKQGYILSFLTATYCFLPFFHARFATDNLSASVFIIGLVMTLRAKNVQGYLFAGLLLGLATVLRMQTLFFLAGGGLWLIFVHRAKFKYLFGLLIGFGFALFLGVLSDRWFYGEWVNTTWNYVYQNSVLKRSHAYGVEPFYYYFERIFLDGIPPFSLVILASFALFFYFKPKNVLTWVIVPFVLLHFVTAHKEIRFLFPLLNFVPLIFVFALKEVQENFSLTRLKGFLIRMKGFYLKPLFLVVNSLLLLYLGLKPADNHTPVLRFLYTHCKETTMPMYYDTHNPYDVSIGLNFYKTANCQPQQVNFDTLTNLNVQQPPFLLATEKAIHDSTLVNLGGDVKLVYSSIPPYYYWFNFNGWVDRTAHLMIYEVR